MLKTLFKIIVKQTLIFIKYFIINIFFNKSSYIWLIKISLTLKYAIQVITMFLNMGVSLILF